MDFIDEVRQFSAWARRLVEQLQTEEATKQALVLPFLQLLGYNVFDPSEVVPEFTADVGTKKGEKVDYAILREGKPAILIEAKAVSDPLVEHDSQLFRYFAATEAKFAILTNGIVYKFYSDLTEPNKMDREPFLVFDLLDPREAVIAEVKKFHKENFNIEDLTSAATTLKYTNRIKELLDMEMREPSEDFLRFWLERVYEGRKITQRVLESFRPVVKRSLNQYVSDLIADRLKSALQTTVAGETAEPEPQPHDADASTDEAGNARDVQTTVEELEAFFIVKSMLRKHIEADRIGYKDTKFYFSVILDGRVTRWVCRLRFGSTQKVVGLRTDEGSEERVALKSLDDLFALEERLVETARRLAASAQKPS